jgi:hypothetical protein
MVVVVACGKRGDPRPPVPIIPQATSDLVVTQRADQVILSWSYPSLTTTGRALTAVERISVFRYVEDLPVAAPNVPTSGDLDPTVPRPVALFSKVPTLPQAQFAKLGTRVESIEKANLPAASAGSRLVFADRPQFTTTDGRPVRITYAVVTEGESARSEYSNLAIIVPLPVAVPPAKLTAVPKANGVTLTWEAPTASVGVAGVAPFIHGYHIYRTAPGQAPNEFMTPINNAPVKETTYTDAPPYGEHEYRVAAVAAEGPPRVQSNPSEPVRATFKDLVPPPAPASVTPLLETKRLRLIWDAVEAPDLDGYIVYRVEGKSRLRLAPWIIKETHFIDISLDIGIAYHYEVTSIDTSKNESAPVRSETVIVPKSP